MLPKPQRLRSNQVKFLLRKGHAIHTEFYTIRYFPNKSDQNRFGVIVSGKICKKATDRNRVRRKIYETIRRQGKELKINNHKIDCIIISKNTVPKATFNELTTATTSLINKLQKKS